MFTIDVLDQCPLQDIQMVLICLDCVIGESRQVNMALEQIMALASMIPWLSSTGISRHSLLPHILNPPLPVNSSPHPGVAAQSLNSSSQLLCLAGPTNAMTVLRPTLKKAQSGKWPNF